MNFDSAFTCSLIDCLVPCIITFCITIAVMIVIHIFLYFKFVEIAKKHRGADTN